MKPWLRKVARSFDRAVASPVAKVAIPAVVLAAAAWLIRRELQEVRLADVAAALRATPAWAAALATAFTAASYACLAAVEWSALRLVGHPQPLRLTALRSFVATSLSGLVGFGLASGTAVRVRVYASAKLPATEIAELVVLCTAATDLTGIVTLGLSALAALRPISAALAMPMWATALAAGVLVASAALWFVLFRHGRPGAGRSGDADRAAALCAGVGDWVFSGAALFVLTSDPLSALPAFLAVFCLGSLLGALAGVPGGLGVLEATVLGAHVGSLAHATVAALLLYRLIYFLGPAAVALAGLAASRLTAARSASRSRFGA